jgi:hypothetical protein
MLVTPTLQMHILLRQKHHYHHLIQVPKTMYENRTLRRKKTLVAVVFLYNVNNMVAA